MKSKRKAAKTFFKGLSRRVKLVGFILLSYVLLLLVSLLTVSPEQYNLKVGDVAPKTITASRDIVDEQTTQKRRKAAADAVSPVYYQDETVSASVLADLDAIFAEMRSVRELGQQIRTSWADADGSYTEEDYAQASGLLTSVTMSNYQLRTLMSTDETDFELLYQSLTSATRTALVSTITEGQINDAINNIQQIVAYNTRTDLWYNVAIPALRTCIRPNMLINQEATEESRQRAYDAVEATVYKRDQNIVVKGDRVTAQQIAVLDALGLLQGERVDYSLYFGAAALLAVIMGAVYLYVRMFEKRMLNYGASAFVLIIALELTMILSVIFGRYVHINAMPSVLGAMLVVNLMGAGPAYVVNFAISMLVTFLTVEGTGLATAQMLCVLIVTNAGGMLAIYLLRKNPSRLFVLITGLIVGVLNFGVQLCFDAISSNEFSTSVGNAAYMIVGSFVAAVLCVGLQPILEAAFNLVTPAKLMELANPNQPLLRRLMIETPGTYHHSMVVANLAEAAAEAVGANALLCRVGAYYHDIGKLVRPLYFKENQRGDNPHDRTDPRVSTSILTEHTLDGEELARKHHLPEQIIDMIRQHHGDTPVMYFYAKAVKDMGAANVDIGDFRYAGPKPQSSEAAILMLSDTVEAAVRSIHEPTQEKISAMIHKLVRGKMEDGQLDECTLTFRDIGHICDAYETVLKGVFHERIEYPDVSRIKRGQQVDKAQAVHAAKVQAAQNEKPQASEQMKA